MKPYTDIDQSRLNTMLQEKAKRYDDDLKRAEDERIKREIIEFIKTWTYHKDWLAWLEKQAAVIIPKFRVGDIMRTLQEAKDNITDGMPVVVSIDKEYYHCTNELIAIKDQDDYEYPPMNRIQTPADKVEPKFKVGDWIVDKSGLVQQVLDFRCGIYTCTYNSFTTDCESNYHLWIIQDAKDGDVLVGKIDGDSYVLIYKQIKDGWIETYGHYYNTVDRFCVPSQLFCRDCKGTFYPATKEQRDLLFQKMIEAGYEWDAEKKELKLLITNGGDFNSENCEKK